VEATLTGEPEAARKDATAVVPDDAPLAERATTVYQGTTVADGHAHAVVFATGQATELGRIGQLVGAITPVRTPLERRLDALGRRLAVVALAVAAVVAGLSALQGAALPEVVQLAIALAVAAVPEGCRPSPPSHSRSACGAWPGVARVAPAVETPARPRWSAPTRRDATTGDDRHPPLAGRRPSAGRSPARVRTRASSSPATSLDPARGPCLVCGAAAAALATSRPAQRAAPAGVRKCAGDRDVAMLTLLRKAGIDAPSLSWPRRRSACCRSRARAP
jgi:hypothetical protein